MLRSIFRRRRNVSPKQAAARWVAAIVYVYIALGIPLPTVAVANSTEPYPCMSHRCGCPNAEACWRHCCCMSLWEKLVWARENRVEPPAYVLAEAESKGIQWHAFLLGAYDEPQSTCGGSCHTKRGNGCCTGSNGHSEAGCSTQQLKPAAGIVLIEALKCRGADQNWHGLSASLPPPQETSFAPIDDCIETASIAAPLLGGISFPPDLPPPRPSV